MKKDVKKKQTKNETNRKKMNKKRKKEKRKRNKSKSNTQHNKGGSEEKKVQEEVLITSEPLLAPLFTLERAAIWTSAGRKDPILPLPSWQDTLTNSYGSCLEVSPGGGSVIFLALIISFCCVYSYFFLYYVGMLMGRI